MAIARVPFKYSSRRLETPGSLLVVRASAIDQAVGIEIEYFGGKLSACAAIVQNGRIDSVQDSQQFEMQARRSGKRLGPVRAHGGFAHQPAADFTGDFEMRSDNEFYVRLFWVMELI